MKKLLLVLFLIVFMAQPLLAALDPSIDDKKTWKNAYRFTGKPKDLFLDWCVEVEDALDGSTGVDFMYFVPSTEPDPNAEGQLYYDASADNLIYRNASGWVTIAASTSSTLDEAYNAGNGITVDGDAMTLTITDSADNTGLIITQNDVTNDANGLEINMSTGTGDGLAISGASGTPIQGDNFSISGAGLATLVGVTTTGDVLFTGASYNIEADVSRDQIHFLDNSVLALGGATTEVGDITLVHDGTNLLIEAATQDNTPIKIGATNAVDILIYDNAATGTATFNSGEATLNFNAYDILMQDGDIIAFGDSDDFTMTATDQAMTFQTLTTDETSAWNFGADTDGSDLKLFGATTGAYMLWDASGDELFIDKASICLSDGDAILFGDTLGTGDFSLSATADVLTYSQVVASTGEIVYGASGVDIPLKWNGETAADWVYFNADEVEFEDVVLQLMDDTQIQFGDGDDFYITSGTAKTLDIIPGATADSTAVVNIGADGAGADLILFGETASHTCYWDASEDEWIWGVDGDGVDVTFYGDTASAEMMWDTSANQLLFAGGAQISLNDAVELLVGTGVTGAGDYEIFSTNGTSLTIDTVVPETGIVEFGVTDLGVDVKLWAATNAEGVMWDASDEALEFTGANLTMDAAGTLTVGATVNADTVITTGSFTVTAAMSGKILVIPDLAGNTVIDLPAEADGLNYEFWYVGAAAESHDHTIDTEDNGNVFIGGLDFTDTDDDVHTPVYSVIVTNSQVLLSNLEGGSIVKVTCDGTNWYITGQIISDTAPSFADQ